MGWSSSSAIQVDNVTIEKNASDQLQIKGGAVTSSLIQDGTIVDADINASAAIAKTKLAALNIADVDVAAGATIAKTKLAALNIVDADVAAGAAIAKAKLAALGIVNADIAAGAAIDSSKLAHGLKFVSLQSAVNSSTGISWSVTGEKTYFLHWWVTDVTAVQQNILLDLNNGAMTMTIGQDNGTGGDSDYAGFVIIQHRPSVFNNQGTIVYGLGASDGQTLTLWGVYNTEGDLTTIKIKPASNNKTFYGVLFELIPHS